MEEQYIFPSTKKNVDILFYGLQGEEYVPSEIIIDNGTIKSIKMSDETQILREDLIVVNNLLEVPGIGYIAPGAIIRFDDEDEDYILNFGWHTNMSNQEIYSWYLSLIGKDEFPPYQVINRHKKCSRTLYKEMINKIKVVQFTH